MKYSPIDDKQQSVNKKMSKQTHIFYIAFKYLSLYQLYY